MYTFISLCIGLLLLSGVIFKKKIAEYQFFVYVIIIFGAFVGSTIVNGVLGLDVPYSKVLAKEEIIESAYTNIWVNYDTISNDSMVYDSVLNAMVSTDYITRDTILKAPLNVIYTFKKDSLGNITKNSIYVPEISLSFNALLKSDSTSESKLKIYLTEDTVPRIRVYKYRRIIESNWVAGFGLPSRGDKTYELMLHDNENNRILLEILNENYYGKKEI